MTQLKNKKGSWADVGISGVITLFFLVLYQLADPRDFYYKMDENFLTLLWIKAEEPNFAPKPHANLDVPLWTTRQVQDAINEARETAPVPHVVQTIRVYPPKLIQDRFWRSNNFNDE